MSARSLVLVAALTLGTASGTAAWGQDAQQPEVENSRVAFAGQINSNAVYVRSGPSENYYPTQKLDEGAPVTVVGIKFDWLKILPPANSFSYVAKAYVEKTGANTGRVTRPAVNVRAGSDLNPMKSTIQTKLEEGQTVTILGEEDEYYKIKPPEGAYLFVSKQYVTPVRALAAGEVPQPPAAPVVKAPVKKPEAPATALNEETTPVEPAPVAVTPRQPVSRPAGVVAAEEEYDQAQTAYEEAMKQPLEQQPVAELAARYEKLSQNENLPATLRRNAQTRYNFLQGRVETQKDLIEAKRFQEESNARLARLKAEQEALRQQAQAGVMRPYAALGKLEISNLQQNGQALYRLVDPGTGRTLVYIRPKDASIASRLGNFVGVRGDIVTDEGLNIKVIAPTWIEQIDPAAVNKSVTAQIVPPSLLSKGSADQ